MFENLDSGNQCFSNLDRLSGTVKINSILIEIHFYVIKNIVFTKYNLSFAKFLKN